MENLKNFKVSKDFKQKATKEEMILYNIDLVLDKIEKSSEEYKNAESLKLIIGNIPADIREKIEQKVLLKKLTVPKLEVEVDTKKKWYATLIYILP